MQFKAGAVIAAAAFAAAGCVIVDGEVVRDWDDYERDHFDGGYGSVKGAAVQNGVVDVTVSSNGCTNKDFIDVDVKRRGELEFALGFERIRDDHCRALKPEGVTLSYTFEELGLPANARVRILNPIKN